MNPLVNRLIDDLVEDETIGEDRREMVAELIENVISVAELDAETEDLRMAVSAIDELLAAFNLFAPWRDVPKVTIFGSARTRPDDPLYALAGELAAAMAERGWLTVTGAGPGIMEAATRGAGTDHSLGVNINLPFEQRANLYVDAARRLITMKYFFTRKVALTRPSNAFVTLPGGLGTMDELFEVLTLIDTGKTTPAPVVLLDRPGGRFWDQWFAFVDEAIVANEYVDTDNFYLARRVTSVNDAVAEIERFYSNYRSFATDGERGVLAVHRLPSEAQLAALRASVPLFDRNGGYRVEGRTITFDFDGRNYVNLRQVIDQVNGWL